MSLATLSKIVGLYARYTRLSNLKSRSKDQNIEIKGIRAHLIELGLEIG